MANSSQNITPNQKHTTKKELQKKKRDPRRILLIVAASLLVLFLIGFAIYHAVLDYYLGKLNIVTKEEGLQYVTQVNTEDVLETTVEEIADLHGQMNQKNIPLICDTKDVKNVLLMATDSRKGEAGLSDTMILCSINAKTKKIVLCSFMRDTYAYYPQTPKSSLSGKYAKLNCAHAYGGPDLTMAVFKENYNIEFFSLKDLKIIVKGIKRVTREYFEN